MSAHNQNPEQEARDSIDAMLEKAGWAVQDKDRIDHSAAVGIAVRECPTEIGPADYVLYLRYKETLKQSKHAGHTRNDGSEGK